MNAVQDIYCECDGESCTSAEKCYCSLRGHPAEDHSPKRPSVLPEKGRVEGTRLHVPHSLSQPHQPPPPPPPMMRSKNNTTIIHCNGSSTMSSTCSSCICGSGDDSGSTATDTTCYSIHRTTSYAPLNKTFARRRLSQKVGATWISDRTTWLPRWGDVLIPALRRGSA